MTYDVAVKELADKNDAVAKSARAMAVGITPVTYVMKPGGVVEAAIAPACHEIRKAIMKLGVR